MMKKWMIILLSIMLVLSMTGCKNGSGEGQKENGGAEGEATKSYAYNDLDVEFDNNTTLNYLYVDGTKAYYSYNKYVEYPQSYYDDMDKIYSNEKLTDEQKEKKVNKLLKTKYKDVEEGAKYAICCYDIEAGTNEEIMAITGAMDNVSFDRFCVGEDGTINVLVSSYDMESANSATVTSLRKYDSSGNVLGEIVINELLGLNDVSGMLGSTIYAKDGTTYMFYSASDLVNYNTIYAGIIGIGADGKLIGKYEFKNSAEVYVEALAMDEAGTLYVKYFDGKTTKVAPFDLAAGKEGEELTLASEEEKSDDLMGAFFSYNLLPTVSDKLYFKDSQGICEYDSQAKDMKKILKFIDSGVSANDVYEVCPTDNGKFVVSVNDMNGKSKLGILGEGISTSEGKTKIKYVGMYSDSSVQEKIVAFNKENENYSIDYVTYDDNVNADEALANDIMAGNYPDIIDLSSVDYRGFVNKGYLADLSEFIDSDDRVNRDFFIDGLLDAISEDGKIYSVVDGISLRTLVANKDYISNYENDWTFDNLMKYYGDLKKKNKDASINGIDTKEGVFYTFTSAINPFVNEKTGEVSYNSDRFKAFMELCNSFPSSENISDDIWSQYNEADAISKGKQAFITAYISTTADAALYKEILKGKEVYIGYPDAEKGNGTFIAPNACYGIMDASENKEGAWEFIKYLLTSNIDENNSNGDKFALDLMSYSGIPTNKVAFENNKKIAMITKEEKLPSGETLSPRESYYSYGEQEIIIGPATEEEFTTVLDLIKNSSGILTYSYSEKKSEIINEEVNKYFSGKKNIADVMNVLQDRMTKYINENM